MAGLEQALGTLQSAGLARQVSSQHLNGMLGGQLVGVLQLVRSVVQLPSGQGTLAVSGGVGGSGGQLSALAAQLVSRQRTGRSGGQMKAGGHWARLLTHSEPTLARGQLSWLAAQLMGSVPLQLVRHEPSAQREELSGQVT